jgi:formate dehydrogenase maturation protein FdhE
MTPSYDARIERANYLKTLYPFAAEVLEYYARVCAVQKPVSVELQGVLGGNSTITNPHRLRERIDVELLLEHVRTVLNGLIPNSPEPLSIYLKEFLQLSEDHWRTALQSYVAHGGTGQLTQDAREELACRVMVSPYAELLATKAQFPEAALAFGNSCSRCAGLPLAGVLRPEGDGGKRFLLCSFCGAEWEFRRILCAHCGEENEKSLPVYVAEKFAHIRVEACDTCKHCLRTIDLTKEGRAIPVVDDLAAIPLALWAEEYGYTRIHRNLLGT